MQMENKKQAKTTGVKKRKLFKKSVFLAESQKISYYELFHF